jgi:hypothetical protein
MEGHLQRPVLGAFMVALNPNIGRDPSFVQTNGMEVHAT